MEIIKKMTAAKKKNYSAIIILLYYSRLFFTEVNLFTTEFHRKCSVDHWEKSEPLAAQNNAFVVEM